MCLCRRGERPRYIVASGGPLLDAEGQKHGAVVIMHDVTVQRESMHQLEEAAEDLQAAKAELERERASLALRVAERTAELTAANSAITNTTVTGRREREVMGMLSFWGVSEFRDR